MTAAVVAEFASAEEMLGAVTRLRSLGFPILEWYAPYPVSGAERELGKARPSLPRYVFGGGVIGAILGYGIQWYANAVDYPQNIGGRPAHAVAAFIPATFEAAILGAALVAFFGLLVALRLPRLWHPVFEIDGFDRASVDRFWLAIREPGGDQGRLNRVLSELQPLRVVPLEQGR